MSRCLHSIAGSGLPPRVHIIAPPKPATRAVNERWADNTPILGKSGEIQICTSVSWRKDPSGNTIVGVGSVAYNGGTELFHYSAGSDPTVSAPLTDMHALAGAAREMRKYLTQRANKHGVRHILFMCGALGAIRLMSGDDCLHKYAIEFRRAVQAMVDNDSNLEVFIQWVPGLTVRFAGAKVALRLARRGTSCVPSLKGNVEVFY